MGRRQANRSIGQQNVNTAHVRLYSPVHREDVHYSHVYRFGLVWFVGLMWKRDKCGPLSGPVLTFSYLEKPS